MADRLQWMLELQDRLSGPAARMDRELGRVRSSLKALDIEARQNKLDKITDPLKRQRAELQLQRDKLMLSKAALDKAGGASRKAASDTGYFTRQLHDVLHIAQIVGGALERMGRVAAGVGRQISKAVSFREGSLIGLETMFGSGGAGVFDRLAAMAGKIGKPIEQLVGLGRSLANVGVRESDIEPMVRLIEDLDAMDPGAGDKLAGVIKGIFGTGKMGAGDIEALRGTILKPEKLYEDIAQRMGAGRNRLAGKAILETEIGVGKNIGVQTLLQSVLDLEGGRAGAKSTKGGQTLESRISRVGIQIERMFSKLAGSKGVKAFEKVLDNLVDIFNPDSASGKHTLAALQHLSDVFAKFLEPLTGPDGKKRMEEFFDSLADKAEGVIGILGKLASLTDFLTFGKKTSAHAGEISDALADRMAQAQAEQAVEERRAAHVRMIQSLPGSRPMDSFNRGLAGAEVNVMVQVDARGASKDDAEHIAQKSKQAAIDAVTEALDKAATQKGAQP
jgi:hypothetical protein